MSNAAAAALIASRLASGLPHPGDADTKPFTIPLPALRSTGIPPEMARQFASDAGFPTHDTPKMMGEAIVHLLETEGDVELVDRAELAQLRQDAADAPDGIRVIEVVDERNEPMFNLTVGKGNRARMSRDTAKRALS